MERSNTAHMPVEAKVRLASKTLISPRCCNNSFWQYFMIASMNNEW